MTPTSDITTMLLLALPLLVLFGIAMVICVSTTDVARRTRRTDYGNLSDDEASTI